MSHNRWTVGVRSKRTYRNLLHIGGQWVAGQKVLMSFLFQVKRVAQLALQELNLISQFNFSLALPDIVANKTLRESALSGKFFFQSYASKPFASTPCLGDLVFCFSILLMICFSFMSSRGQVISFPDLALNFRSVLWRMNVCK